MMKMMKNRKCRRTPRDQECLAGVMPGILPGMPEGAKTVWMKDEKSGIRPVPVTVGIENGSNVEILSGLKEGDEVIISMTNDSQKGNNKSKCRSWRSSNF